MRWGGCDSTRQTLWLAVIIGMTWKLRSVRRLRGGKRSFSKSQRGDCCVTASNDVWLALLFRYFFLCTLWFDWLPRFLFFFFPFSPCICSASLQKSTPSASTSPHFCFVSLHVSCFCFCLFSICSFRFCHFLFQVPNLLFFLFFFLEANEPWAMFIDCWF